MRAGHADRSQARGDPRAWASRGSASASRTSTIASSSSTAARTARRRSTRPTRSARALDFPQINIDLIAGMLGETEENWRDCVEQDARARARQRHHLPDGAAVQHDDQQGPAEGHAASSRSRSPTGRPSGAGWRRRSRRSSAPAITSAAPTPRSRIRRGRRFVYRDRLWQGADMVGPRRRVVRPRQRRPHAEPRHVGDLQRRRSTAASCRSAAPTGRPTRSG